MTWKSVQLPLSSDEIRQVLENFSEETVLIGGQALALWSQVYNVPPPTQLSSVISADMDFIGSTRAAKSLGRALNRNGGAWKLYEVDSGDSTPQTAKLSLTVEGEGYKEIDFLWAIVGVDADRVRNRAVEIALAGISRKLKVIHPLDLLASRLHNLADLPRKRNAQGVAQAQLAISIVRAFVSQVLRVAEERDAFPFVEEIRRIALNRKLARVYYEYGFDVLSAVPVDLFKDENFHSKRWPQIQALVAQQRGIQAELCSKYPRWSGGPDEKVTHA
ncbi:MAG TPA: hypothetical protein VMT29_21540 [Steroidobacteraceae bacterium]|nr:hypothetical protein [Steroidobacteraceae bacterium]